MPPASSSPGSITVRPATPTEAASRSWWRIAWVNSLSRALRLRSNPWAVLVVLCLGLFMTLLDITIVQIATPSLSRGLHASLDQVLWVVNAYSLLYAVLLITAGPAFTSAM